MIKITHSAGRIPQEIKIMWIPWFCICFPFPGVGKAKVHLWKATHADPMKITPPHTHTNTHTNIYENSCPYFPWWPICMDFKRYIKYNLPKWCSWHFLISEFNIDNTLSVLSGKVMNAVLTELNCPWNKAAVYVLSKHSMSFLLNPFTFIWKPKVKHVHTLILTTKFTYFECFKHWARFHRKGLD